MEQTLPRRKNRLWSRLFLGMALLVVSPYLALEFFQPVPNLPDPHESLLVDGVSFQEWVKNKVPTAHQAWITAPDLVRMEMILVKNLRYQPTRLERFSHLWNSKKFIFNEASVPPRDPKSIQEQALQELVRYGAYLKPLKPELLEIARVSKKLRPMAYEALAGMGEEAREAIPLIEKEFRKHKKDPYYQLQLAIYLARIDPRHAMANSFLLTYKSRPYGYWQAVELLTLFPEDAALHEFVFRNAKLKSQGLLIVSTLSRAPKLSVKCVPFLKESLQEGRPFLGAHAALCLAKVDPPPLELLPDLKRLAESPDPLVATMVAWSVSELENRSNRKPVP